MRKSKRTVVVGVAALGLIGGGIAFAAWTSTGTGTGTASATESIELEVTVGTASGLFPTGSVNVPFTVTNPNPYEVTLTGAIPGIFSVDAEHSACGVGSISADDVVLDDVIPASGTGVSRDVVVAMSNDATDACEGATFTFDLVVSGASS